MNLIHSVLKYERNNIGILIFPTYSDFDKEYAITVIVYLPDVTAITSYTCNSKEELREKIEAIKTNSEERELLINNVIEQITNSNQQPDNEQPKTESNTREH